MRVRANGCVPVIQVHNNHSSFNSRRKEFVTRQRKRAKTCADETRRQTLEVIGVIQQKQAMLADRAAWLKRFAQDTHAHVHCLFAEIQATADRVKRDVLAKFDMEVAALCKRLSGIDESLCVTSYQLATGVVEARQFCQTNTLNDADVLIAEDIGCAVAISTVKQSLRNCWTVQNSHLNPFGKEPVNEPALSSRLMHETLNQMVQIATLERNVWRTRAFEDHVKAPLTVVPVPIKHGCFQRRSVRTLGKLEFSPHHIQNIAVSWDESMLAVCNESLSNVTLYSLPHLSRIRAFAVPLVPTKANPFASAEGGHPEDVKFMPGGNLLVADCLNERLQELTVEGNHVRCIGEGVFDDMVFAIDVNSRVIVASTFHSVFVFDSCTGELLKFFGSRWDLSGAIALSISPSGDYLAVVEMYEEERVRRVSIWTVDGNFVGDCKKSCIGSPMDVCFLDFQTIALSGKSGISLLHPPLYGVKRAPVVNFNILEEEEGDNTDSEGKYVCTLAVSPRSSRMFLLNNWTRNLCVFE